MCGGRCSAFFCCLLPSTFCCCLPLDFAAYFLGGFQIVLSIFAISTAVSFTFIFILTHSIFSQAFFLSRTHQPESLVLEMNHLKEMTRAQITSDIQMISGWVVGVYGLAGLAAILAIAGTYKRIPCLVNAFAHIFWGRFVFDSIAFLFLVKHPGMAVWELVFSFLAALVWNGVGVYFYATLVQLWGDLLLERSPDRKGLLRTLDLWPGV